MTPPPGRGAGGTVRALYRDGAGHHRHLLGQRTAFWLIGHSDAWRESGAVLGLAVGYVVKYRLDRRFVFTDAALARGGQAGGR
jgi:hypothetical protein